MKQTVKLNEAQLKKIVAESVKRVLKESDYGWDAYKYTNVSTAFENLSNCIMILTQKYTTPNGNPEIDTEERMLDDAIIACQELLDCLNDVKENN